MAPSSDEGIEGMPHPMLAGHYRMTIANGQEIALVTLYQELTYLNLLWGYPTRSINSGIVQSHLHMAEERQYRESLTLKPVLMPPRITRLPPDRGHLEEDVLNPYEMLPPILSVATFESNAVGHEEACSSVLVVWYQDEWGLPTAPILEQLRRLDWVANARDWTW